MIMFFGNQTTCLRLKNRSPDCLPLLPTTLQRTTSSNLTQVRLGVQTQGTSTSIVAIYRLLLMFDRKLNWHQTCVPKVVKSMGQTHLPLNSEGETKVMVRPDVPDSGRIPSSIFERSKSTTLVEWSGVLLQMNHCSASMGEIPVSPGTMSGELPNLSNSPPVAYPPISTASSPAEKTLGMGHGLEQLDRAEAANAKAMKDVLRATADEKGKPSIRVIQHSDSASRHSDASNQSFAFPMLDKKALTK
ncbi:hypothetical protein Taro_054549, partial [Colocasia esculenta]|nr:hypothetical protein [Colocasia esculenta]